VEALPERESGVESRCGLRLEYKESSGITQVRVEPELVSAPVASASDVQEAAPTECVLVATAGRKHAGGSEGRDESRVESVRSSLQQAGTLAREPARTESESGPPAQSVAVSHRGRQVDVAETAVFRVEDWADCPLFGSKQFCY